MKKFLVLILSLPAYLTIAIPAFAQASPAFGLCPRNTSGNPGFNALCNLDFQNLLPALISTIFLLAIIAALLYLIWGGFKWLTSGGDKAAVQAAREHIVAAIVGLVLIFLAYFILNVLLQFFFGINTGVFTLPQVNLG